MSTFNTIAHISYKVKTISPAPRYYNIYIIEYTLYNIQYKYIEHKYKIYIIHIRYKMPSKYQYKHVITYTYKI